MHYIPPKLLSEMFLNLCAKPLWLMTTRLSTRLEMNMPLHSDSVSRPHHQHFILDHWRIQHFVYVRGKLYRFPSPLFYLSFPSLQFPFFSSLFHSFLSFPFPSLPFFSVSKVWVFLQKFSWNLIRYLEQSDAFRRQFPLN